MRILMRKAHMNFVLLFIALMLYTGCAALPFEGEVLREVVSQNPQGAACRCEAVCQ